MIDVNTAPVSHVQDRVETPTGQTAAEWYEESVVLGRKLTDAEAEALSAYEGYVIANKLNFDVAAYYLEGADGWHVCVYADADPLA